MLKENNLSTNVLCPNKLLSGYVLIPVVNKNNIKELKIYNDINDNGKIVRICRGLTSEEQRTLESIWNLYINNDPQASKKVKANFDNYWNTLTSLVEIENWWNAISFCFEITGVGSALAYTNAKRCDKNIPDLPLD